MEMILHKAETRGVANHGWLRSHHTFSFANYYNPERMGFGTLRVINDDIVAPARGFGTHPHENMEIISVPLKGSLRHQDTIGNEYIIKAGEVQAMSAGTGLQHSEYNHSQNEEVNFLQIWIYPKRKDIKPNYSQKNFREEGRINKLQLVVSPDGRDNSVKINQDAFFSRVQINVDSEVTYSKYLKENGVYFLIIDGDIEVNGENLRTKDGLGVIDADDLKLVARSKTEVLIMEVPLKA